MNVTFFCRLAGKTSVAASAAGAAAAMGTAAEEEEEVVVVEEEEVELENRKDGTEEVVGWALEGGM
jgi:hypothetical protein